MPRTINVGVVTIFTLVLHVCRGNRDAALPLFRRIINLVVAYYFAAITLVSAAVSVVLPWSTCPIVPTFTCGFVLSNFTFDMSFLS